MRKTETLTREQLVDALERLAHVGVGGLFIHRHDRGAAGCGANRDAMSCDTFEVSKKPYEMLFLWWRDTLGTDRRETYVDMAWIEEDRSVIVMDDLQEAWHFQSGDPRFQRSS